VSATFYYREKGGNTAVKFNAVESYFFPGSDICIDDGSLIAEYDLCLVKLELDAD